jgi:cytosine deaminase
VETSTDGPVDVRVVDGVIAAIGTGIAQPGDTVEDLAGWVLLPAPVEPHAHLDKAFLAERVVNRTGDLMGAIDAMAAAAPSITPADIADRAERAARLMAHHGYRRVRTHVDTTSDDGLRGILALADVRGRLADVIDIEIVALAGWPVTGVAGAEHRALLRDALDAGADVVGGCPHLDSDVRGATELVLVLAAERTRPVDLHVDETLDPGIVGLRDLAELAASFPTVVTASHCVSLGQQPPDVQHAVAAAVADADVRVVALPHTNLFLLGRGHVPMPRGLTAVGTLRSAGVTVAAGADNLQDPFQPLGRACPFETAALMVLTCHLSPAEAWDAVSVEASRAIGGERRGIETDAPADLLAVRADSVREAIAWAPAERRRWRRGVEQHDPPALETKS